MIKQNRFYNTLLNPLYEGCDLNDLCVATYLIGAAKEEGAILKAVSIGIEQTTGSWVDVPAETDEMRAKYASKIIGVYEVPNYENQTNVNLDVAPDGLRFYVNSIGYPVDNIENNVALRLLHMALMMPCVLAFRLPICFFLCCHCHILTPLNNALAADRFGHMVCSEQKRYTDD